MASVVSIEPRSKPNDEASELSVPDTPDMLLNSGAKLSEDV
ncbi:MAG: hypothetical protein PUD94_02465 [Prevotellaceae bacterium]|nr:hypothetical protein [Prevotellaceae bacterium]MDD6008008.1 hypothetical protein [Prevotellaceae bacterium]MDD6779866.1 hypothetical protein [Prevotellaceae bacterium]